MTGGDVGVKYEVTIELQIQINKYPNNLTS